jgi:hypothetical protein
MHYTQWPNGPIGLSHYKVKCTLKFVSLEVSCSYWSKLKNFKNWNNMNQKITERNFTEFGWIKLFQLTHNICWWRHLVEQKRLLAAWVELCAFSDRMFGNVVQPTVFHFEVTIAYSAISMRCALSGLCKPATKSVVGGWNIMNWNFE